MTMFRKIIVGIDLSDTGLELSPGSQAAAACAYNLARKLGCEVHLLHSTRQEGYYDRKSGAQLWTLQDGVSEPGQDAFQQTKQDFQDAGISTTLSFDDRRAWLAIIHRVIEHGADLVLVGTRACSDFEAEFDDRRLGSVALKLLRKCPVPVWAIAPQHNPMIDQVLAATDLTSSVGKKVLRTAAAVAKTCDAELHVLHAYQLAWSEALLSGPSERQARHAAAASKAERQIRSELNKAGFESEPVLHISCTPPAQAIITTSKNCGAELVVMGTISRGGIRGVLVGNTAERVLGSLDCSLLTVKPDDFESPVQPFVDR